MKYLLLLGAALAAGTLQAQTTKDPYMARALRVLATSPVIDGHNDLAWEIRQSQTAPHDVNAYDLRKRTPGRTDLARLAEGHVGGQFWSVYVPGEIRDSGFARVQLEQIDIARQFIAKYPDRLVFARSSADVHAALKSHRIASMLGMEGGHAIENSLGALRAYYDLGVRYMTLTHNVTLDWADANTGPYVHHGLTPFGKEVVREMNRLGMLVDLSHVSAGTMSSALDVAEAPVIFSHSSSRALVDVERNVPDSILRRVTKNGGVVMVTFVNGFVSADYARWEHELTSDTTFRGRGRGDTVAARRRADWMRLHPRPVATLAQVADHIQHVRDVAGIDHVGIGGDYDGTGAEMIAGLEDVSKYPNLFAELARRGWSDADLRKLADENILRVMSEAERVASRLQRTRGPSNATLRSMDSTASH